MRLELREASLTYQRATPFEARALTDVSLEVEPGERLGIAGPVGSGKSSLLMVMAGMIEPDAGSVLHDGRALGRKNRPPVGSVGISFQSPERCLFARTVHDDVAFAPRRMGLSEQECSRRVEAALKDVGLEAARFAASSPFSLSSGEQRRVALAGMLAMEPRALLLDEPTANLDPASRADITGRLKAVNRELGTTMVVIGHDMDELARFSERLVIIDGGRKVADGPSAELLKDVDMLNRHGLEPPGTVQLGIKVAAATGRQLEPPLTEEAALQMLLALARGGHPGGGA